MRPFRRGEARWVFKHRPTVQVRDVYTIAPGASCCMAPFSTLGDMGYGTAKRVTEGMSIVGRAGPYGHHPNECCGMLPPRCERSDRHRSLVRIRRAGMSGRLMYEPKVLTDLLPRWRLQGCEGSVRRASRTTFLLADRMNTDARGRALG